jgi:hypothetical protein
MKIEENKGKRFEVDHCVFCLALNRWRGKWEVVTLHIPFSCWGGTL